MVETVTTLTLLTVAALVIFRILLNSVMPPAPAVLRKSRASSTTKSGCANALNAPSASHWGEAMIANLTAELEATSQQLDGTTAARK